MSLTKTLFKKKRFVVLSHRLVHSGSMNASTYEADLGFPAVGPMLQAVGCVALSWLACCIPGVTCGRNGAHQII